MKVGKKRILQIITDALMSIVLILQMSYSVAGELFHEISGTAFFVLFIIHHILSYPYTKGLYKKGSSAEVRLKLALDLLLTLDVAVIIFSALGVSKHLFVFLNLYSVAAASRVAHILSVYWGFLLIGLHIGIHIEPMFRRAMKNEKKKYTAVLIALMLTVSGGVIFFTERFYSHLFLLSMFSDFSRGSLVSYTVKYALLLCFFTALGALLVQPFKKRGH